jgi:hypothetical protein
LVQGTVLLSVMTRMKNRLLMSRLMVR